MEVAAKLENSEKENNFCSLKICDNSSQFLKKPKKKRNVQSDIFTILLLIYHMVQWMKIRRTIGQSEEELD